MSVGTITVNARESKCSYSSDDQLLLLLLPLYVVTVIFFPTAPACTYVVQPADTLYTIAAAKNTTVNALERFNPKISPYQLKVS